MLVILVKRKFVDIFVWNSYAVEFYLLSILYSFLFFFKEMKHKFGTLWNDPRVFTMNILKIASNLWRPLNCILNDNIELQLTLKNKSGTRANYFQANIPSLYQKKTIYFLGNVIYWCFFKHFINFSTKQSEINKERFFGGARILHLMVLHQMAENFRLNDIKLCFMFLLPRL